MVCGGGVVNGVYRMCLVLLRPEGGKKIAPVAKKKGKKEVCFRGNNAQWHNTRAPRSLRNLLRVAQADAAVSSLPLPPPAWAAVVVT